MKKALLMVITAALLLPVAAGAQNRVAVKTNLLHDATASANLGLEVGITQHWSVELAGSYRNWDAYDITLNHLIVRPELKYWFCERFNGWFASAYAMGGMNIDAGHLWWDFSQYYHKFPNFRKYLMADGKFLSAGVGIGYDWILGRHWNLEAELGLGYMYLRCTEYLLPQDENGNYYVSKGDVTEGATPIYDHRSTFDFVGPTHLALSVVYLF